MTSELIAGWSPPEPPVGWRVSLRGGDGCRYDHTIAPRTVIVSAAVESDGKRWLHFSMSCVSRLPKWDEFVAAKEAFLGPESKAIQVIPARSEYVNINPNVLHLFVCLDGDPLPDFTRGSGSI